MDANRFLWSAVAGAMITASAHASEPPTFGSTLDTGRHVYEDVSVIRVTPTHLLFRHSTGVASLPISQLPPEVRVQVEGRIPPQNTSIPESSSSKPSGASSSAPAPSKTVPARRPAPKEVPRAPAIKTRPLWIVYPVQNACPSPLGTGTFPGPRGLPLNWFHVHPSVYPQTVVNPEWRRLAEQDFFITAARNNPALLTRGVVSGW